MFSRRRLHPVAVAAAFALLLSAAPFLSEPPTARSDSPGDWPMWRHDPAQTGYAAVETQLRPPLRLKWSYPTYGEVLSSPVVTGGVLYATTSDGSNSMLWALDATTGALKWPRAITCENYSGPPAVVDGVIYVLTVDSCSVGTHARWLRALSSTNGDELWHWPPSPTDEGASGSVTVSGGRVYVISGVHVFALNASSGAQIWATSCALVDSPNTTGCGGAPAVANGMVYVDVDGYVGVGGGVLALDAGTGAFRWSYHYGAAHAAWASPAVANGMVYVGSGYGLFALDASTGAYRWRYTTNYNGFSSPAVANGVVYANGQAQTGVSTVFALNAQTGQVLWSQLHDGNSYQATESAPAIANGVVYAAQGPFQAMSAATGQLITSSVTANLVYSSPAVAGGMLYIGSHGWNISATGKISAYASAYRVNLPAVLKTYFALTPGLWQNAAQWGTFYVTPNRAFVRQPALSVYVDGCGFYVITHNPDVPIANNHFAFSGDFYADGTFSSATAATVSFGLSNYYVAGCGYLTGGPWAGDYSWVNSSQPSLTAVAVSTAVESAPVAGVPEAVRVR